MEKGKGSLDATHRRRLQPVCRIYMQIESFPNDKSENENCGKILI